MVGVRAPIPGVVDTPQAGLARCEAIGAFRDSFARFGGRGGRRLRPPTSW